MKIAHLSDLHICTQHRIENLAKFEKLIQFSLEQDVDHIVITGDMSHNAYKEDFEAIRMLLWKYDLLDSQKLSITIGNHDIFGGVHFVEDIFEFPGRCRRTNFKNQVNQICAYFKETFEYTEKPLTNFHFPYLKDLGEIVLIGLNSIAPYSRLKNPLASNGHISSVEFEALKKVLQSKRIANKRKIVLIHHHFTPKIIMQHHENGGLWPLIESHTMKIYGRNKLISLFARNGIKLVLHGHVHLNQQYKLNNVKFLNGGASVDDKTDGLLKVNLIDITPKSVNIRVAKVKTDLLSAVPDPYVWQTEELIPGFAI